MPSIVIFYHPGSENVISADILSKGVFPWNKEAHHRKFLEAEGAYVTNESNSPQTAKLRFWGEWEPCSHVRKLQGKSPRYLHTPFVKRPLPALPKTASTGNVRCGVKVGCGSNLQNTDPFVFAESFYYGICQQITKKGNSTGMQELEKGSIILFGSRVNKEFALDIVFVVGDRRPYTTDNILSDLSSFVPSDYPNLMQFNKEHSLVCYKGANFLNPINGMYSFVPCRISDGGDTGFERPTISPCDFQSCQLERIMPDGPKNQGRKVTEVTIEDCQKVWNSVRNAIHAQDYLEGFNFKY